jgi:hypothetical protein
MVTHTQAYIGLHKMELNIGRVIHTVLNGIIIIFIVINQ